MPSSLTSFPLGSCAGYLETGNAESLSLLMKSKPLPVHYFYPNIPLNDTVVTGAN